MGVTSSSSSTSFSSSASVWAGAAADESSTWQYRFAGASSLAGEIACSVMEGYPSEKPVGSGASEPLADPVGMKTNALIIEATQSCRLWTFRYNDPLLGDP